MDETESHKRGAAEYFAEVKRLRLIETGKEAVAEPEASREDFQESRGRPREVEIEEFQSDIEDLVNKQIEETQVETSSSSSRVGGDVEC